MNRWFREGGAGCWGHLNVTWKRFLIDFVLIFFAEMGSYSTQFAKSGAQELTVEERNILAVAFKNVVGTRRAAWRVLSSIQKKENIKGNAENVQKVKNYKS